MRVLIGIANFGTCNRRYLDRVLIEYRRMPFHLDIVVFSNIPKELGPDIEIQVGLPTRNPRSLPFAPRSLFADRIDSYELFIYAEDDTLITDRNVEAFLESAKTLEENEIAGFLRHEVGEDGRTFVSTVHSHFHWDVSSVRTRGGRTYARFTNEHSACFMLTRRQLRRAIDSGGFLVGPHAGRYAMLESAATDPYTQCGLLKLICVSDPRDFIVKHLPNKYVGTMGLEVREFHRQLDRLQEIGSVERYASDLLASETKLPGTPWSKSYYEPPQVELLALIPSGVRTVLSLGCGWGETERVLVDRGARVVGIPLDPVIAASAELRGVETICGNFSEVCSSLRGRVFDCLLLSNMLHLVPEPTNVLAPFSEVLRKGGIIVASGPNHMRLPTLWRRIFGSRGYEHIGDFDRSGLQDTTVRRMRHWFRRSGFVVESVGWLVPGRSARFGELTLGLANPLVASGFVVRGRRR